MTMNLGKLLFAGKSVTRGGETIRYRESKQVALPKFVSPKNPLVPKPAPQTVAAPCKNQTPASPVTPPAAPSVSGASRTALWTAKWNPASLWHRPRSQSQTPPGASVQAELSLETVRVVHNDLSDTDVEVVPVKSRPVAAAPAQPMPKRTWEILGERLLKATAL